jgi:hypothetical protein
MLSMTHDFSLRNAKNSSRPGRGRSVLQAASQYEEMFDVQEVFHVSPLLILPLSPLVLYRESLSSG